MDMTRISASLFHHCLTIPHAKNLITVLQGNMPRIHKIMVYVLILCVPYGLPQWWLESTEICAEPLSPSISSV